MPPPRAVAPDAIPPAVPAGPGLRRVRPVGFRVPCAIVSPWARPRYVSHRNFDHASICKLVETKWNLPAMTYRDANAAAMLDLLDLRRPAFRTPPRLAAPLLDTDPAALACDASGPGVIPPPGSVTHHPRRPGLTQPEPDRPPACLTTAAGLTTRQLTTRQPGTRQPDHRPAGPLTSWMPCSRCSDAMPLGRCV